MIFYSYELRWKDYKLWESSENQWKSPLLSCAVTLCNSPSGSAGTPESPRCRNPSAEVLRALPAFPRNPPRGSTPLSAHPQPLSAIFLYI